MSLPVHSDFVVVELDTKRARPLKKIAKDDCAVAYSRPSIFA